MKLGKIERHILIWAHRQRDERGVRCDGRAYHGKSGALLAYARERFGTYAIPKTSLNIKATMPREAYSRLHSSFTRALKRLAEKGLIVYEPRVQRLLEEARRIRKRGRAQRRGEVLPSAETTSLPQGRPGARRSMFVLTPEGESVARKLWATTKGQESQ